MVINTRGMAWSVRLTLKVALGALAMTARVGRGSGSDRGPGDVLEAHCADSSALLPELPSAAARRRRANVAPHL